MKKDMRKISVRGSLSELRAVIEELKTTQAFELSSFKRGTSEDLDNPILEHYSTLLARISAVIDNSKKHDDKKNKARYNQRVELEFDQLKNLGKKDGEVLTLIETKEAIATREFEISAQIKKYKDTIKELRAFESLDTPLNHLNGTDKSSVTYGIIPKLHLEKFREDFDLDTLKLFEFGATGEDEVGLVILAHKHDQALVDMIHDYDFRQANFPFDKTAKEQIAQIKRDIGILETEDEGVKIAIVLTDEELTLLKQYYDYVNNELDTENILAGTIKAKDYYILNGWVLDSEKKNVETVILAINPSTKIKWGKTVTLDTPPVYIKNSKLIAPYQSITNMYGAPGRNDIDPNPFVAFFYFIFFGMMVADIGYGLLMGVIAGFVLYKVKPQGGAKNLMMIIAMAAVSTIIWGLFFGSFFGIALLPYAPVIDLLNDPNGPMMFLVLAMGVGVLHIMAGIALKFYNLYRQGQVMDAIFDAGFRLMFFLGVILAIAGSSMGLDISILFTVGVAITLAFVVGIALTAGRKRKGIAGKLVGGFGGLYSFVGYISDILSYARIFGLGLVGAVIAMVANTMAELLFGIPILGYPFGVLIAVAFHAFNLALCLLSAYIHNARLQFIEFFSKFYDGSGSVFKPMGGDLRFVTIVKREVSMAS